MKQITVIKMDYEVVYCIASNQQAHTIDNQSQTDIDACKHNKTSPQYSKVILILTLKEVQNIQT